MDQHFQSGSQRIAGVHFFSEVEEEEEAIDRSLLGACHTQLLTSFKLQHCQCIEADVLMGCH